jgi:ATP-dependent Clp protease ATP-binding subunit ClpA
MLELEVQLEDRGVSFELSQAARIWLADKGFDDAYGARPLARTIQSHVKKPLSDAILFGDLKNGGLVKVDVDLKDSDKLDFALFPEGPKRKPGARRKSKAKRKTTKSAKTG